MTAETDLLPLPDWMECLGEVSAEDIRDYARDNVAHATAPLHAEIEALRAEVERLQEVVRPKRENECLTLDHWRMRAYYLEENWSRCSRACAVEQTKREQAEALAERLRAEVDEWKDAAMFASEQQDRLLREARALNERVDRLVKAVRDAATSMQTIADKAGRDEYLMTTDEVRCYANSRANAARAALGQEEGLMNDLTERLQDGEKIEFSVNRPSDPDVEWMEVTMRVDGGWARFAASDCNGIELTGHVRHDGCWELTTEAAHFCSKSDAMDVAVLLMTIHDRALDLLGEDRESPVTP